MTQSLRGLVLDDGNILLEYVETAAETNGERHVQKATYKPRSPRPPYHCHPRQEEIFQIIEGGLEFVVDGATKTVTANEELVVPQGAYHNARNPFDAPAIVRWETRPALRSGEMFKALYQASRGRGRPPLHEAAAILREFRDEFVLAKPPVVIQRLVFGCLAPFGRAALRR